MDEEHSVRQLIYAHPKKSARKMLNTLNCLKELILQPHRTTREKSSYESPRAEPYRSYRPCRCICVRWDICDRSVAGRARHRGSPRQSGIARSSTPVREYRNRSKRSAAKRNRSQNGSMSTVRNRPSCCAATVRANTSQARRATADRYRRINSAASADDSSVPTD